MLVNIPPSTSVGAREADAGLGWPLWSPAGWGGDRVPARCEHDEQDAGDHEGPPSPTSSSLAPTGITPQQGLQGSTQDFVIQFSQINSFKEIIFMPIAIIVHGGAGTASPERSEILQAGCKEAALVGWRILQEGGSALDAVEAAVCALEDNPSYNAGTGACLNSDGNIELDAGIMDGQTLQVGAIAGVERIKNPISLARKVLESEHVLLIGRGAEQFAGEQGIEQCASEDLITERQRQLWQAARETEEPRHYRRQVRVSGSLAKQEQVTDTEKHGTVGAVALDMSGALAAATSTGGIHDKYPGRV